MVAYLNKLERGEEFHQIVDFLHASHIRYALTANPTIYVSLIKQFWQTAIAKTLDIREIELTATINGSVKTVTESSVRRHLQLADADDISSLPTTKIFEQLSLMGGPVIQDKAASIGVDVRYRGSTTTVTGLEAGQGSGNIDKTPTMPQDSPLPRVNILGSDKGSMTLQELTVLCITLPKKVESLETDLKQTKLTYGDAYTKLIKKVKKLENQVKSSQARRRAKIVLSNDEEYLKDPSKQGRKIAKIDQDPAISLVQHDAEIQGRQEHDMEFEFDLDAAKEVSTVEEDINTAKPVSIAGAAVTTASVAVTTAAVSTAKDKAELKEEERQRIASVHEAASSFNIEEWDDIQARVKADEELA
ncbi:hypothetical protein Tco_0045399 [Tanacetum coccineum]